MAKLGGPSSHLSDPVDIHRFNALAVSICWYHCTIHGETRICGQSQAILSFRFESRLRAMTQKVHGLGVWMRSQECLVY